MSAKSYIILLHIPYWILLDLLSFFMFSCSFFMHIQKWLNQLSAFLHLYLHVKIRLFHLFSFEIQSSSMTWLVTPIFDHAHPKYFWSTFNLCKFVSTCKESGYFIDLFWRCGWLKNPAIWLAENILAISQEQKIFPNMGFVQEHSK